MCLLFNVMYQTCQESKAALMTKSGVRMEGTTFCGKKHCKHDKKELTNICCSMDVCKR